PVSVGNPILLYELSLSKERPHTHVHRLEYHSRRIARKRIRRSTKVHFTILVKRMNARMACDPYVERNDDLLRPTLDHIAGKRENTIRRPSDDFDTKKRKNGENQRFTEPADRVTLGIAHWTASSFRYAEFRKASRCRPLSSLLLNRLSTCLNAELL